MVAAIRAEVEHGTVEVFLRTERMVLRRFTYVDVEHLVELDSDPLVMRFLGTGQTDPEVVRNRVLPGILAEYERSTRHGRWAAVDDTGVFLGWFSLASPGHGNLDEANLGYRLRRSVWGRGLATEGGRALVWAAFARFGLQRVFATTMAVNLASRRVMEKAGLRHIRTFHLEFDDPIQGTEHGEVEYALTAREWGSMTESPR
jgi:RimJ/RimL family protein N-acetyltransferase